MVLRTNSLVAFILWIILASRLEVPVSHPVRKIWRLLWYFIAAVSRCLMIPVVSFQRTSNNPMHWKSLPYPLVISTAVFQEKYSGRDPSQNPTCTNETTFSQLVVSGSFSRVASHSHW